VSLNKTIEISDNALDSTIDDVTVHHQRGAPVHYLTDQAANTVTGNLTAIAVPSWANAIILHTTVATYGGTGVTFYVQGQTDNTSGYGILYQGTTAFQSTHSANGTLIHSFKGLCVPANGAASLKISVSCAAWNGAVANAWYQFASI